MRDQPARRALRIAAVCAGLLVATYLLSAHTIVGSRFETAVLRSPSGLAPRLAARPLDAITAWSVTPAVLVVGLLGWRRGGPLLGWVAAGLILASIGTADLLQHLLPLACGGGGVGGGGAGGVGGAGAGGGGGDRSFPSGHAAVAASVIGALLLIGPHRFRAPAALLTSAVLSAVAALTVTARWHRPSDTIGSALITLIYACAATALLARCGRLRVVARDPVPRRQRRAASPRPRRPVAAQPSVSYATDRPQRLPATPATASTGVDGVADRSRFGSAATALAAQAALALAIAAGSAVVSLASPAGSGRATGAALTSGLAVTVAVGGLTALTLLALLRNCAVGGAP